MDTSGTNALGILETNQEIKEAEKGLEETYID
jgi:hypothetical protein